MSLLSMFGDLIQRPQSALTGGVLGLARDFGYRDPRTDDFHPRASTPWQGIVEGAKGGIHPHELIPGDSKLSGIAGIISDLGVDPLLMLGGAAKGGEFGAKAGGLAEKALSAGHVAEGDSKLATLLARGGRRTIQGTLAAGGNPVQGLTLGMLQGGVENLTSRAPAIAEKLASMFGSHVDEAIRSAPELADSLSEVPSAIKLNPKDFAHTFTDTGGGGGYANMPTDLLADVKPVGPPVPDSDPIVRLFGPKKPATVSEMIDQMYGGRSSLPDDELATAFMRVLQMNR